MEQGNLAFSVKKEEIPDTLIQGCKTFRAALRLCMEVSALEKKDIAFQLEIHENHLSRMVADNPDDSRHFPTDKIDQLMDVCGNEIPLRWLALKRGYGLYRLKTALELENEALRAQLEQERREREVITRFLKETKV